jgi:hypothetical protein
MVVPPKRGGSVSEMVLFQYVKKVTVMLLLCQGIMIAETSCCLIFHILFRNLT